MRGELFMPVAQGSRGVTQEVITNYLVFLKENEKSSATVIKYIHDLNMAAAYFNGKDLTKAALIEWKDILIEKYAAATVNSILAALNGFLKYMGWADLVVKPLKIQRSLFRDESRELSHAEYKRLVNAAESAGNRRLSGSSNNMCHGHPGI